MIFSFAVGAFLVSLILAVSVFTISRGYMVGQRERSAERQAITHAELVRAVLAKPGASAQVVLGALEPPVDTVLLLRWGGHWFASESDVGPDSLPMKLVEASVAGASTTTPMTIHGRPILAVAIPLNDRGDILYELAPLNELEATLRVLRIILSACAFAATIGGGLLGLWASRRVLTPLHQLAHTAADIAGGELESRLPDTGDRDLVTIIASFNTMVDSLQRRIERERRFFGDVSHELRTPLTTLITSVGVLSRHQQELPDRSRRALELITAELDHLYRLLEDLLALARTEAGLHQDPLETMSVGELLLNTLARSKRRPDLLAVEGDCTITGRKSALERAFVNLMDNADRHGGGLMAVAVCREGSNAVVVVDDGGDGVAEADRDRIFERFATAHAGRRSPSGTGTGLGLALVAETLAAHGGNVKCGERPGGGARFIVTLPVLIPN